MRKSKIRKNSKQSLAVLKRKADKIFGDWVKSKGDRCYTCNAKVEGKNKQAGHFHSRTHSATRYHIDNVRIQCFRCNIWLRGNIAYFAGNLIKELGAERFHALAKLSKTYHQLTRNELEKIIKKYGESN